MGAREIGLRNAMHVTCDSVVYAVPADLRAAGPGKGRTDQDVDRLEVRPEWLRR
jgi:hypothetical protein